MGALYLGLRISNVSLAPDVNCTVDCPTLQESPNSWPLWVMGMSHALQLDMQPLSPSLLGR